MKTLCTIMMFMEIFLAGTSHAQKIKHEEVKQIMEKVADWQVIHFRDNYSGHATPHHPLNWTNGALYVGMVKWAAMADSDKYYNWLKNIGSENKWQLYDRIYHADDHTVGQLYI